ncbi:hypothetical protein CBS147332_2712 [Penicillium roqueforti]|nr:hypothetical protein CBS147332_2712 [Penicillium roqueforti]KAI3099839.1 hypothetical protein CBS147331_8541 [Penicillium roqueforti]
MHLPILLLLSASLASAQFGNQFIPSPAGLKYPKPINRHPHYVQNTNKEIDNYDNYDYDDYDYDNIPSLPTPTPTPSPSPTPRIHSTFLVRPSQTPTVQAPAHGYGHVYNHPSQGPDAESRDNAPSFRGADDNDDYNVSPGTSGGVAPIDPLAPGSQVAPAPLFVTASHGKDEGNAFCSGRCFEDEEDAQCAKPYALAIYKPAKGCYMCCITSDF